MARRKVKKIESEKPDELDLVDELEAIASQLKTSTVSFSRERILRLVAVLRADRTKKT